MKLKKRKKAPRPRLLRLWKPNRHCFVQNCKPALGVRAPAWSQADPTGSSCVQDKQQLGPAGGDPSWAACRSLGSPPLAVAGRWGFGASLVALRAEDAGGVEATKTRPSCNVSSTPVLSIFLYILDSRTM